MTAPRKKPGWVNWTAVVLVALPVLYVASLGPACWIGTRIDSDDYGMDGDPVVNGIVFVYRPLLVAVLRAPQVISKAFEWYVGLGAAKSEEPQFEPATGSFVWKGRGFAAHVIHRFR